MIVTASSFADPADVRRYKRAIAQGKTEQQALAIGDNGLGCWGDETAQMHTPMCALPPEDWKGRWGSGKKARGKRVIVTVGSRTTCCVLADTMPSKEKITNGAGIDLNPAALASLGLKPPILIPNVKWEWAEGE